MGILNNIVKIFQKEKSKLKELEIKTVMKEDFIEINLSEEFLKYDSIKDLINQYDSIDVIENNMLKVAYEDIYEFYYDEFENEIKIYEILKLPHIFRGIVEIENRNNFLVDEEVKYLFKFRFLNESYIIKNKNILQSESTREERLMTKGIYNLVKELVEYNLDKGKYSNVANQFEMLKVIKDSSILNDIKINDRLEKEETPIIIDKIKIDCEDDGKVLNIYPRLSEDERVNKEILKSIDSFDGIRNNYSIKLDDKKVRYIVKNEDSLEKVLKKEKVEGEERLEVLGGKGELFQDENIDISSFGPRVTGIGYLNYRSSGRTVNTNDLDWLNVEDEFPYFATSNLEGDFEKIVLKPKHKILLQQKLGEIEDSEAVNIEIDFSENEEEIKKVIMSKEDIRQEIFNLNKRTKGLEEVKKKGDLEELIKMEPDEEGYFHYKGKYIFAGCSDYKEEIKEKLEKIEKRKEEEKTLLIAENFEETDYKEVSNKKYKLDKAIIPNLLKDGIKLFEYQEECVRKLQEVYMGNSRNGFLLCDDMGLGKTLQLLTFLGWLKEENNLKPSLIVAPSSLLNNWDNEGSGEIQKFFKEGSFKTEKIVGRVSEEKLEELKETDIVFITYESLRINNLQLGKINWKVMICDEAQKIKNPTAKVTLAAKAQNADFKIICSATPIENSLEDLWCLVDYSKPGLFGSLKDFKDDYINNNKLDYKELNDELYMKLEECYIRREKDILPKELPKKIIKMHKVKATNIEIEALETVKETEEYTLTVIQKMLALSNHIDVLGNKNIDLENIEDFIERSSKMKEVLKIIKSIEEKNEKVIIFTRLKRIQQILYYAIKKRFNVDVAIVNGEANSNKRTRSINEFRSSKGFNVIILSPEVAGFGITITEANHVIHYSRLWNPAKEDQATDRAYRIGQTKDVSVYYPILSYEENKIKNYEDVLDYVEENKEKIKYGSAEENLNTLIARKKDMLINFFLAGGAMDLKLEDFKEIDSRDRKRKATLEDIKRGVYSKKEIKNIIAEIYKDKGYEVEVNNGEYGEDLLVKDIERDKLKAIIISKNSEEKKKAIEEKYKENLLNQSLEIENMNLV